MYLTIVDLNLIRYSGSPSSFKLKILKARIKVFVTRTVMSMVKYSV